MKSILVWINSAPASSNLSGAFQLAQQMRGAGRAVSIVLSQDAVLAAIRVESSTPAPAVQAVRAGIRVMALGEDLALRGFAPDALSDGVGVTDYAQMLDLFEQHDRVLGAL